MSQAAEAHGWLLCPASQWINRLGSAASLVVGDRIAIRLLGSGPVVSWLGRCLGGAAPQPLIIGWCGPCRVGYNSAVADSRSTTGKKILNLGLDRAGLGCYGSTSSTAGPPDRAPQLNRRPLDKLDLLCYCCTSSTARLVGVAVISLPSQGRDHGFESRTRYVLQRRSVKAVLWWDAQAGRSGQPGG